MSQDSDGRRRLRTPLHDAEENNSAGRRSRSPERGIVSRGGPRHYRSRSTVRRDERLSDRGRSPTRRSESNVSRTRYRSRSQDRRSDSRRGTEVDLHQKCEKLEHLLKEIRSEQRRIQDSTKRLESRASGSDHTQNSRQSPRQRAAEKRTRQHDYDGERSRSRLKRSDSPGFSARDVANILNSIKNPSTSQSQPEAPVNPSGKLNHKNILPEFDPSSKTQTIDKWLRKVNECATVYGWDDKTIIHFAIQKLQGLAKTWYDSLDTILFTWLEWQAKLKGAFPYEQNYGQSLEDMLKRRSRYNEPIEVYYYEKIALLNRCGIEGKNAVDCVIHGLNDKTMRSAANALRCSHPDQLLQFLLTNKDAPQNFERPNYKNRLPVDTKPNNSHTDHKTGDKYNSQLVCYNCKEKGHPYLKCPKPLAKCTNCAKLGHTTEQCRIKPATADAKPEVTRKQMCISSTKISSKFSKEVLVNTLQISAFIDFGSEVSLMTKSTANLLGQNFKVVTDCSALRSTFSKRDIIPRVARWWLLLQEFQCSIEYRSGSKMTHVDALSRNPIPDKETADALDQYPTVMTISTDDWLQTLQLGDSELGRIKDILTFDLTVDNLKHIKDNYVIQDNRLYKCIDGDKSKLRWVVPRGARWQLCRLNHDEIGHFGVEKTLDRIKNCYWFPKMANFVKKYVNACVQCAFAKKSCQPKDGQLHVIEKIDIVFHTVHIDHLGPFVRSKRGNTHLLVIVEAFTKFVFIRPVRNTNTMNALRALQDVFYTFRFPDRIISDRGSCFTSHAFRRFCLDKGIKHIQNSVASPRSNGQVERYNRSILDSLTAQNLNHDEKEWDEKIGIVQWGLNNTKQKTTGRSPAEVMFGVSMDAEVDPRLNEIRQSMQAKSDVVAIREEVKDRIREQQIKQKEHYDKNRKPAKIYKEQDLVKITKVSFNNDGKSTKLMPSYIGPYRVVRVLGNDRYKVAAIPGLTGSRHKRSTVVAADRMLPWVHIAALDVQDNDSQDEASYSVAESDDEMLP